MAVVCMRACGGGRTMKAVTNIKVHLCDTGKMHFWSGVDREICFIQTGNGTWQNYFGYTVCLITKRMLYDIYLHSI